MVSHSGSSVSVKGESRITPLGAKLRKYKLDELPELWNVLIGDMSFVGPRPDVPGYADKLEGEDRRMLLLKPGITGPASLKYRNEEELLAAIGSKAIILGEADKNELKEKQTSNWKKYLTFSFVNGNKDKQQEEKEPQEKEKINPKQVLKLTEESLQKKYIMAECCHPIPGDDVLGYVDENDRIIIHKRQCPVAAKLKSSYGNRILATEWDTHKELSFLVYIYIKGIDSMGLLNEVTQVISRQLNVNIRKLTIETEDGIFEGKIQLWVHDVEDVKTICNNLKKIQNIKQVSRVEE